MKINQTIRNAACQTMAEVLGLTAHEAELIIDSQIASPKQPTPDAMQFRAAADDKPAEIVIDGVIGFGLDDEGITASGFRQQLADLADQPEIAVRINSRGGDVFEGFSIYSQLNATQARVVVTIEGVAASAASVIAMAGDEIRIAEPAEMMIHNASGIAMGTAQDMLDLAAVLTKIDGQIASVYSARTGKRPAAISKLMNSETWMTGAEAVAAGFADSVIPLKGKRSATAQNAAAVVNSADFARLVSLHLTDLDRDDQTFRNWLDKLNGH